MAVSDGGITVEQRKLMFALCNNVGVDDDTRHEMQKRITGKASCTDMSKEDAAKMINHLKNTQGLPQGKNSKNKLLGKIEKQLKAQGYSYKYGDSLAKRICKVDKLIWCNSKQLQKIIAALWYDNNRKAKQ